MFRTSTPLCIQALLVRYYRTGLSRDRATLCKRPGKHPDGLLVDVSVEAVLRNEVPRCSVLFGDKCRLRAILTAAVSSSAVRGLVDARVLQESRVSVPCSATAFCRLRPASCVCVLSQSFAMDCSSGFLVNILIHKSGERRFGRVRKNVTLNFFLGGGSTPSSLPKPFNVTFFLTPISPAQESALHKNQPCTRIRCTQESV